MFNNPAVYNEVYLDEVPADVRKYIQSIIEDLKKQELGEVDYSQRFCLSNECLGLQTITRLQEQPEILETYYFPCKQKPVIGNVFVLDEHDHHLYLVAGGKGGITV